MASNVSIPKGTRDFSPTEMIRRKYIFNTVEDVFRLYGYQPIETPAMENLGTLTGKYGEEGDRLIFKILNSGNFLEGISNEDVQNFSMAKLAARMCEKALRYDLTVPFARYVVQNRNDITFPFKRYQIQPVWRADRPQKGRYREFYQCDVDVIGSNSLLNEVELIQIIDKVFLKLGLKIIIKINNRKILSGIAEVIGESERIVDIVTAIDKFEKIGKEGVIKELQTKGIPIDPINRLIGFIDNTFKDQNKLDNFKSILLFSEVGKLGIAEIESIFGYLENFVLDTKIEFDPTLARGLNYYTGAIFEVKANDASMGSICGGGRYDDLTSIFGLPGVSGVGVSFGADRIYDVMNELDLFPSETNISTKILFVNFGSMEEKYALEALVKFREAGIASELYPEAAKMKKQFSYADSRKIPFVAMAGSEEINEKCFKLKNMTTGQEKKITVSEMIIEVKNSYL